MSLLCFHFCSALKHLHLHSHGVSSHTHRSHLPNVPLNPESQNRPLEYLTTKMPKPPTDATESPTKPTLQNATGQVPLRSRRARLIASMRTNFHPTTSWGPSKRRRPPPTPPSPGPYAFVTEVYREEESRINGNLPERLNGASAKRKLEWIDEMLREVQVEEWHAEINSDGEGEEEGREETVTLRGGEEGGDADRWAKREFWDWKREEIFRRAAGENPEKRNRVGWWRLGRRCVICMLHGKRGSEGQLGNYRWGWCHWIMLSVTFLSVHLV